MRPSQYMKQKQKMAMEAKKRRERAWKMREAGMTLQAIGDSMGVTKQMADYMVKKHQAEINKQEGTA